jgi:hypothetical protein
MKKISFLFLLAIILISTTVASAQQEVIIDNIYIELRPEFDRPEVLVVYTIALNESLNYPVDISVKIPASSGGPAAVWEVVEGAPVATTYDVSEDGDWLSVNIQTETPVVYIDFYDPEFKVQNTKRSYTYKFPPGLISDLVELVIWQPAQSENFQASIELPQLITDELGTTYHVADLNPDELNRLEIDFSYDGPAFSDNSGSTEIDWLGILPWALGILGAGIVAFGIFNSSSKSRSKTKSRKKKNAYPGKNIKKQGSNFCHSCGSKIEKTDKFCSDCGEKAR